MKKKIFWVYIASIFVLFLAVGFIAKQWWVGADQTQDVLSGINFKNSSEWLGQCKSQCSQFNVVCGDCGGDIGNYAPENPCEICIRDDICTANNITPGNNSIDRIKSLTSTIETGLSLNGCMLIHEIGHACDKNINDQSRNQKCTEVGAQQAQLACEKKVIENICAADPSSPSCVSSCQDLKVKLPAMTWDACMCSTSSNVGGVDNSVCCSCVKECRDKEYYKNLLPSYCGEYTSQSLEELCSRTASASPHDCNYYNDGVRDESKKCNTVNFDPELCRMQAEYFKETKEDAQNIVDNSCAEYSNKTSANGPVYLRGIIDILKPMKCKSCTPEENASDIWCPENFCMETAGYIKYTCIDSGCDLGSTSSVKVKINRNVLSAAGANLAHALEPLEGVNIYAQRINDFYQGILNAPRELLGTTDSNSQVETNITLGKWTIIAQKAGYKTVSQTVNVLRGQPASLELNMTTDGTQPPPPPPAADKTLNISVDLSTQQNINTGIYGATVKISKGDKSFTRITPNTGDLSFPNLEAGTWNIEVTKPGYTVIPSSLATANVAYPTNQAYIMMTEAQSSLTIRSVDQVNSSTNPISGVAVTIEQGIVIKTQTTDSNGATTFTNLVSGDWVVTGAKTSYHQDQPLTQSVNDVTPTTDLIMDSDIKNLTIRVKTTSGANMANIQVKVTDSTGTITKTTASNGTAVFNGLRIGQKTIAITKSGWVLAANQVMAVNLQESTTKDITMQRSGSFRFYIKGRLLGVSIPLPGATIELCNKPFSDNSKTCWKKTANYLGMRTFEDMAPGKYYFQIKATNYASLGSTLDIPANSLAAKTIQLERPSWYVGALR